MFSTIFFLLALSSLAGRFAFAQQFPTMKMSYETLNLTGPCFEALNATVECSDRLAKHVAWDASSVDLLDQDGLANVCEATCRQSLVDLRTKVLDSCDASADTIQYSYLSFPATYIVDRYLYFYDVSCYKDKSTGSFCDTVVAGWRNETGGSEAHYCDDCWLGPMSVQLRSPIGFNEDRASVFASLTSSCSIDAYATPTPTPYGEATATFGDVVTTAQASTTDAATATATATEVTSAEEMMPSIYPLLEVGTAASADAQEGKENTRKQRRNRSKKASAQSLARQVNPRAPGTSEDCPKYQSFLPFELTYKKADRNKEFLDDFGINGCGYTATKHGITLKNFLAWNPSLAKLKDCKLQRGYSYCVRRPSSIPKTHILDPAASNATMTNSTVAGANLTMASSQNIKRVRVSWAWTQES